MKLFDIPTYNLPAGILAALGSVLQEKPELEVVSHWPQELWSVLAFLQEKGEISKEIDFIPSLVSWVQNIDHGMFHNFCVFQGMMWMAEQENLDVDESIYQILAVFHDLGNLLLYADFKTGAPKVGNRYREHPKIMADFFRDFGGLLGLSTDLIEEIGFSLEHHDNGYFGSPIPDSLPTCGRVLSDVDKLFSMTQSRNPLDLVKGSLLRNLMLAEPKLDGWYFIRPELGPFLRDQFQYGDRWLTDNTSANRSIKYMKYSTKTGREIGRKMNDVFVKAAHDVYQDFFDRAKNLWKYSLEHSDNVYLVAKGKDGLLKEKVSPKDVNYSLIEKAYNRPLELEARYLREPYTDPRGWNIAVEIDGQLKRIDPSVIRFKTKEEFLEAVTKALQ